MSNAYVKLLKMPQTHFLNGRFLSHEAQFRNVLVSSLRPDQSYRQAQERFDRLIEQMKQAQGITEQLKSENVLEWVQRPNNIRAYAREIVDREIIYA